MSLNLSLSGAQIASAKNSSRRSGRSTGAASPVSSNRRPASAQANARPPTSSSNGVGLFHTDGLVGVKPKIKASTPAREKSGQIRDKLGRGVSNHSVFQPASARSISTQGDDDGSAVAAEVRRRRQDADIHTFLDLGSLDRETAEVDQWLSQHDKNTARDWDEIPLTSRDSGDFATPVSRSQVYSVRTPGAASSRHPVSATADGDRDALEEMIHKYRQESAASTIQCWWRFRRHLARKRAVATARDSARSATEELSAATTELRKLLGNKKKEVVAETKKGTRADAGRRRKEEAARLQRQKDIAELRERRSREAELKKQKDEKVAEEEVNKMLQAGKIRSARSVRSSRSVAESEAPISVVSDKLGDEEESGRIRSSRSTAESQPPVSVLSDELDDEVDTARQSQLSVTGTKTTLEDILSTLKQLEEDPDSAEGGVEPPRSAWVADIDRLLKDPEPSEKTDLTALNLQQHLRDLPPATPSSTRLQSFLQSAVPDTVPAGVSDTPRTDLSALELQSVAAVTDVASRVTGLQSALTERDHSIQTLQRELRQQRELNLRNIADTEREVRAAADSRELALANKLTAAEATVATLVEQNRALQTKTEKLLKLVQDSNSKHETRLKALTERHAVELQKVKEFHEAQEKVKRERWEQGQTERIKELTMKGMEPEIQRLIADHRAKLKRVEEEYQRKLMETQHDASGVWQRQVDELRDSMQREQDAAVKRERDAAKHKYEQQLESELQALEAQRRRLYGEVAEERERAAEAAGTTRAELDAARRAFDLEVARFKEEKVRDLSQLREDADGRARLELEEMRKQLAAEKSSWENTFRKQQEADLLEKERALREACKAERDREIELAISRLEEDTSGRVEKAERLADEKVRRIREKCDRELRDSEKAETDIRDECKHARKHAFELEGELERLRNVMAKKEEEAADIQALYQQLHQDRKNVQDVVRQEFADRLVQTDEENRRLKSELAEARARQTAEADRGREELTRLRLHNEEEMAAVHQKVLEAIKKKEDVVNDLKQRYKRKQDECEHLQSLLEQQRKQLASVVGAGAGKK